MGEVYRERRGAHTEKWGLKGECREGMQRNQKSRRRYSGAALVACLSMEHITTGFNSQRWKNHFPKAGQWVAGVWSGVGGRKGVVGWLLGWHACVAVLGMVAWVMGLGEERRWAFSGPESLGPEGASLWEWAPLAAIGLTFDVHTESYLGVGLDMGVINIPSIPRLQSATVFSLSLSSQALDGHSGGLSEVHSGMNGDFLRC